VLPVPSLALAARQVVAFSSMAMITGVPWAPCAMVSAQPSETAGAIEQAARNFALQTVPSF